MNEMKTLNPKLITNIYSNKLRKLDTKRYFQATIELTARHLNENKLKRELNDMNWSPDP